MNYLYSKILHTTQWWMIEWNSLTLMTCDMTLHDIRQDISWLHITIINKWQWLVDVKSSFWKSMENQFQLLKNRKSEWFSKLYDEEILCL